MDMTESIDNRCWEYYGFPDPALMTPRMPYLGLIRALAERIFCVINVYKRYGQGMRFPPNSSPHSLSRSLPNLNYDVIFSDPGAGLQRLTVDNQYWNINTEVFNTFSIDQIITGYSKILPRVARIYLNQNKLSDIENISSADDLTWTIDELYLAAAGGDESKVVKPGYLLEPEFSLRWIIQQYKALNLLRYVPIPYTYDTLSGYGPRSGKANAVIDAYHAARSDLQETSQSHILRVEISSGFPKVWNDYSSGYYSTINCFSKCGPVLEAIPENSESWLIANFTGTSQTRESFGLTTGKIQYGWNALKAENGVFLEYDINQIQDHEIPVVTGQTSETKSVGWRPVIWVDQYYIYAYADFYSTFYFKQEDNNA